MDAATLQPVLAKLSVWRDIAAGAGRTDDAAVLAVALRIIQDASIRQVPATVQAQSGPQPFVPTGVKTDANGAAVECCPWPQTGGCGVCTVSRPYPFAIKNIPGRAFMCLTYWMPS